MMMRSIRANTKWIMVFLAVAFAAWLVLDWVQSRDTQASAGANPVIAVVNGQEIRYVQWSNTLEVALNNARLASGGAVMTDEETRQVELVAWDQLIQDVLIQQEIDRLGIEVLQDRVTAVDPAARSVTLARGGSRSWDKLLIATGGNTVSARCSLERISDNASPPLFFSPCSAAASAASNAHFRRCG